MHDFLQRFIRIKKVLWESFKFLCIIAFPMRKVNPNYDEENYYNTSIGMLASRFSISSRRLAELAGQSHQRKSRAFRKLVGKLCFIFIFSCWSRYSAGFGHSDRGRFIFYRLFWLCKPPKNTVCDTSGSGQV